MKIQIINGPNLNMLGKREAGFYGNFDLAQLSAFLLANKQSTTELSFFQSNAEDQIIETIHKLEKKCDAIIINAAALTHTSIGIRDALLAVQIPFIEVHISNVFSRESFRHVSMLSDIARGVITGLGMHSYLGAMKYFEDPVD